MKESAPPAPPPIFPFGVLFGVFVAVVVVAVVAEEIALLLRDNMPSPASLPLALLCLLLGPRPPPPAIEAEPTAETDVAAVVAASCPAGY